jgi:hypothetical protein
MDVFLLLIFENTFSEVVARCFFSRKFELCKCLLHGWSAFDAFVQARLSTETLVSCIVILILG